MASVTTFPTYLKNLKDTQRMQKTKELSFDIDNYISKHSVLFFDLDGTLVDTDYANFLAYKKAIFSVTNSDPKLQFNPDIRLNRSNLKSLVTNLKEIQLERIIQKKEEYYIDFLHKTQLNAKVANILNKYSKSNMTVLVTNCRKNRVFKTLNHFGLAEKFSNIFCRTQSEHGNKVNKFQNAITHLNLLPNVVIAFENEESEIQDAMAVGIKTINPIILL